MEDETKVKNQFEAYRTKLLRNNKRIEEKEYLTDALSRESVDFICRNADKPFFIYLAYNAPHGPLQATEKYLERNGHIKEINRKTYAAMVSAVDDGVGAIVSKLKEKGYNIEEKFSRIIGRVDAIMVDEDGNISTGADPRGDDFSSVLK